MRLFFSKLSKLSKLSIRKHLPVFVACVGGAALLGGGSRPVKADAAANIGGTAAIYGNIPPDQIEFISTGDRIKSIASSGSSIAIWETLEHGERVECLDCIPSVEPLLFDQAPRTREIAAWWLRRRLFGVFGPGQVYERTVGTLANDADENRRAFAAEALGEFLAAPGIEACATAISNDASPKVRAAAAKALGRLNDNGRGALAKALGDSDTKVRLAALGAASRVNNFSDSLAVARLTGDGDALVRRRAADLLGGMHAIDGVDALMGVVKNDADAEVRSSAAHALGQLHDPRARAVLEDVKANDANGFVRDQADMALRRL